MTIAIATIVFLYMFAFSLIKNQLKCSFPTDLASISKLEGIQFKGQVQTDPFLCYLCESILLTSLLIIEAFVVFIIQSNFFHV